MTTTTWTSVFTNGSDANFRDWGSKLSAALAAVGMVKTADTGQINWTTVTAPGAVNTQQGYEVWRFNDTLQATAPIFLRIGYGSGTTLSHPAIWITIGKGSDGTGTITGTLLAALQTYVSTFSVSTLTSYMASGDGSSLVFCLAQATMSNRAALWAVERSRTAAGAATADGVMLYAPISGTGSLGVTTRAIAYGSGAATSLNGYPVGLPASVASDNSLAIAGAAPVYPGTVYTGGFIWQPRAILVGMRADVGNLGTITVPGFGTYLSLGAASELCDVTLGAYSSGCMVWS